MPELIGWFFLFVFALPFHGGGSPPFRVVFPCPPLTPHSHTVSGETLLQSSISGHPTDPAPWQGDSSRQGRRCPLSRRFGGSALSSRRGRRVARKAVADPKPTRR